MHRWWKRWIHKFFNTRLTIAKDLDGAVVEIFLLLWKGRRRSLCPSPRIGMNPWRAFGIGQGPAWRGRFRFIGPDVVSDMDRSYQPGGHSDSLHQERPYTGSLAVVLVTIVGRTPLR